MKRTYLALAGVAVLVACSPPPRTMAVGMGLPYVRGCPGDTEFNFVEVNRSTSLNEAATLSLVTLDDGVPVGISAVFSPNPNLPEQGESTVAAQIGGAVAPGRYSLRIKAEAAGVVAITPFDVLVRAPSVDLTTEGTGIKLKPGESVTLDIAAQRTCYTGPVTLTVDSPTGINASVNPSNVAADKSTSKVTIGTDTTTPKGNYKVRIISNIPGATGSTDVLELAVEVSATN